MHKANSKIIDEQLVTIDIGIVEDAILRSHKVYKLFCTGSIMILNGCAHLKLSRAYKAEGTSGAIFRKIRMYKSGLEIRRQQCTTSAIKLVR